MQLFGVEQVDLTVKHFNLFDRPDITSLEPLLVLPQLERLMIRNCANITDLSPLAALPNLSIFALRDCPGITSLEPLSALPLRWMLLRGCPGVASVAPLRETPLKYLVVMNCPGIQDLETINKPPLRIVLDGVDLRTEGDDGQPWPPEPPEPPEPPMRPCWEVRVEVGADDALLEDEDDKSRDWSDDGSRTVTMPLLEGFCERYNVPLVSVVVEYDSPRNTVTLRGSRIPSEAEALQAEADYEKQFAAYLELKEAFERDMLVYGKKKREFDILSLMSQLGDMLKSEP
jgi:hypothetical protein